MSPTIDNLTFFCTNTSFLLSQVPLASFVPKKKQPYQDVEKPYEVSSTDFSVRPDEAYEVSRSTSSDGIFSVLATKFASFTHQQNEATAMQVSAIEGGNLYTLDKPDDLFEKIVFGEQYGPSMQAWLEKCVRKKWKPRFVVGLRTFFNVRVASSGHKSTNGSATVTAPISSAQGDPSGVADVEFRTARQNEANEQRGLTMPSERIYSICYWKIHISNRGGKVTPELKSQKNVWRAFYNTRNGGGEDGSEDDGEEEIYQAGLEGQDNDTNHWDVHMMKALGGDTIRLAFALGDHDDDSDDDT